MSETYLDKPQEYWDCLLFQAEDLLRDSDLGVHLVGAYAVEPQTWTPSTPSEPGLVGLYLDNASSLLNPCYHMARSVRLTQGNVRLIHLFDWVMDLIEEKEESDQYLINSPILHEDESIADIVEAANDFIQNNNVANKTYLGAQVEQLYRSLI